MSDSHLQSISCDRQVRQLGCIFTAMRWACCAAIVLSGCYAPKLVGGSPCDPGRDNCPSGYTCVASGGGGGCSTDGAGTDGGTHRMVPDGAVCLGSGLLGTVCLSRIPTGPVTLSSTINTGAATGCTEV